VNPPLRHRPAHLAAMALCAALACGCHPNAQKLVPVPAPDATDLEPSVRKAMQQARAQLDRVAQSRPGKPLI